MNRRGLLLAIAAILVVAACVGDTKLPSPTGKANVRAINAIPGSPEISFRIEEQQRLIGAIPYQGGSGTSRYDDFDYTFNFEVFFAGDDDVTRIASQYIDFTADADYTMLLTGTLAAPTVTVWESAARTFDAAETVFQARFAHASNTWGTIDVYFAPDGTAPVPGEQVATLSIGEISGPMDFDGGEYVVTVTVPKNPGETIDPADILYTSEPANVLAQSQLIVMPFDGDANDVAPVVVRGVLGGGSAIPMHDPVYPSTIHFIHSSIDLGDSDIYDDEALTSQVVANHQFMDVTADIPVTPGDYTYRYTPTGSTAAVTFETDVTVSAGVHQRVVTYGSGGTYNRLTYINDRASQATTVKVNTFHASDNFDFLTFYAVEPGGTIDEELPFRTGLARALAAPSAALAAGAYDLYVTETGSTDVLAGPVPIDVQLGDVLDLVVFDTADPAILELRVLN